SAVMIVLNIIVNASMGGFWGSLFQLGVFLAVPLLMKYNGVKKGGKAYKCFFYIFYPAHLLVLAILRYIVLK
ncbi:MAG: conjugal transfer protein TraX, partial [Oscillospiraceae bacterium]|nr:conjugal transfer protein TraX [Oscillospiraceae bacterium]